MALQVDNIKRAFKFKHDGKEIELADPGPHMTPEDVMNLYSHQYSELTTATIEGPAIENDVAVYGFKQTVGTKG